MFNSQYYPTPENVISLMLQDENLQDKNILEPSAGAGHIVKACKQRGGNVIACENDAELKKLLSTHCTILKDDFLQVTAAEISHIHYIIMNPPFNADERHILHAYEIAPAGCKIIALCNLQTVLNPHNFSQRERLKNIIDTSGHYEDLGQAFTQAERKTGAEIALVKLLKPGAEYSTEFEGFFMEEEPEQQEGAQAGLMSYNMVRDLVHRYIEAVKIYDQQLDTAVRLNTIIAPFHNESLGFQCTKEGYQQNRGQFKKDLQKSAWQYIFLKMDLTKIATQGLKADINKFVETQSAIPFTMKNIFRMLEIVIGTTGQRMDKAIIEVFDRLTTHYHENRHNVEGWKTNSHYLLGQKFILPRMCPVDKFSNGPHLTNNYGGYFDLMEDLIKAICFVTGDNYEHHISLSTFTRYRYKLKMANGTYIDGYNNCFSDYGRAAARKKELGEDVEIEDSLPVYGELFEWTYFNVRAYKKGTMHFEFKSEELWARINQRIAKIKGYPLFEHTQREAEKKRKEEAARASSASANQGPAEILFTFKKRATAAAN